jgi:hypothetical protein
MRPGDNKGEVSVGGILSALALITMCIVILPLVFLTSTNSAISKLEGEGYIVLAAGEYTSLDALIDAIKAKTDNLPTDPADHSLLDAQLIALDNLLDAIKLSTDNLPTDPADQSLLEAILTTVGYDHAILEQKWDAKPRPYPYDTATTLTVSSNATVVNTFGNYVRIIPAGTFDFGDTPNSIQLAGISIESMDTNAVYVMEFYRTSDNITYTAIGALRFNRTSVQTRSFLYEFEGREANADTEDIFVRLKSSPANAIVTFSVLVVRHISTDQHIPTSPGVFPFG